MIEHVDIFFQPGNGSVYFKETFFSANLQYFEFYRIDTRFFLQPHDSQHPSYDPEFFSTSFAAQFSLAQLLCNYSWTWDIEGEKKKKTL